MKQQRDPNELIWRKLDSGDRNTPPRAHLFMHAIAERVSWRAEYDRALLAASPPGDDPNLSAASVIAA